MIGIKNRMGQVNRILLLVLLIGAGGAAGGGFLAYQYWYANSKPELPRSKGEQLGQLPSFGKLRSGSNATAVAALGRLQPKGQVIDIGGLMGDRLEKLLVQEGQQVQSGQILGYLESHADRQAERDVIAAQLTEAKARLEAETAYAKALIAEAQTGLHQAEQLDPLDVRAQEARVQLLETVLAAAQSDLERLQSVRTAGTVPAQQLDQQAQQVRRAQQELIASQATLAKARAGQELSQKRAQAQLAAAEAGLRRAQTSIQIDSLTRNLALADVRLAHTVLRAPQAGTILQILARPGERVDQQPILRMGDTSVMYAVAEVYETDVLLVRPGQRAQVTSPALTQALTGQVERVGWMIRRNDVFSIDPGASADARVVQVWIRLDSVAGVERLTNLQVDVAIDLALTSPP